MIKPNFSTIMNGGDDIARQAVQFEANVSKSLTNIANQAQPKLAPTNLKTAAYTALLDELVVCNGTFNLMLPVATPSNQGREIGVIVRAGTVTVITASGLVQGAASDALAGPIKSTYVSTGTDWWR